MTTATTLTATPDPDDQPRQPAAVDALRAWALHLAADMGWRVFPVAPGANKPPAVREWEQRATNEPDRITRCWSTSTPYNVGIATGPSGLLVIDLDQAKTDDEPDGTTTLADLCAERGVQLPDTYTVETPSGGQHHYYQTPAGVHLGVSKGAQRPDGRIIGLGPRVDTRGQGGYVVAAGSVRPDGAYHLINDQPPAELPAWVVQVLCERRAPTIPADNTPPRRPGPYAMRALAEETRNVRLAPAEQHNSTTNKAAFNLGTLIGAGLLDLHTAHHALTDAAAVLADSPCKCTTRELDAVIRAGLAAGTHKPRYLGRAA